jgi:hypothetical protein
VIKYFFEAKMDFSNDFFYWHDKNGTNTYFPRPRRFQDLLAMYFAIAYKHIENVKPQCHHTAVFEGSACESTLDSRGWCGQILCESTVDSRGSQSVNEELVSGGTSHHQLLYH